MYEKNEKINFMSHIINFDVKSICLMDGFLEQNKSNGFADL